jgi:hypothetical protein
MTKKLALLSLSLLFFKGYAEVSSEGKDKYAEWCSKLNLNSEQLKKVSRFLSDFDRQVLAEEKLQSYRASFKGDSGYKMGTNEDVVSFLSSANGLIIDPLLLKTLALQILPFIVIDVSYALPDESLQKFNTDYVFSEQEEEKVFFAMKESVKKCRLCVKSKLREEKANEEKKAE